MQPYKRTDRASSVIREAISTILLNEVRDPDASKAIVTHVKVSADFSLARINVRCMQDDPEARKQMLRALRKAAGFLRTRLATQLNLFKTPELVFHYDDVPDKGARIESLLKDLSGGRTMDQVAADEGFDRDNAFDGKDD
ncbi:MAG TPA: 30S ribosome-binding factor RbfA [Myxococcota bacterium]|nr:30S ribosome-binding factor RbfA [Myxococcota bacterium]HOA13946.1 30S ribosome-binding factor RbfA [Myxococcota bacterium]HOC99179.1 30S ribosome-binding factor RbfA [Myxococcota bacterium]HOH77251.1 30S ribosome-binding factor RbfA [Myxococcota bacterium]HPV04475.1 30S ribosome-binding factor RbfA [Myxococcota bacterium]